MTPNRHPRLLRLLVVCCAVCLAIAGTAVAHLMVRNQRLNEREGRLLAEERLQQVLVASTAEDHSVLPHMDPGIGPVLNPAKRESTWRAAAGERYEINSLGLRGREIGNRREGVARVVLIGDSVIFGWRISDGDRIGETIERVVNELSGKEVIEVFSVALPSWNISSEVAFAQRHLNRLKPDYIVWNLLRNDILDVPAAVPPGVLGAWASRQKTNMEPFSIGSDFQYELPMPSILGRWRRNLDLIADFTREQRVPGLVLSWMPDTRAHIEHLLRISSFPVPVVHLPGFFRNHERWPIEAADPHPTPWATHAIAVGLIDNLCNLEVIDDLTFSAEDAEIAEKWQDEANRRFTPDDTNALLRERMRRLPTAIDPGNESTHAGIVYGIRDGFMSPDGLLCLRADDPVSSLVLEVNVPETFGAAQREMTLTVRSLSGDEVTVVRAVNDGRSVHEIELPACGGELRGWEVEWGFDFAECSGPRRCFSARFLGARLVRG